MYSPQSTQQVNPFVRHAASQQSGFPWRLLLLSGVLLGLTILIYAGMAFGYRPYLETNVSQIDAQLAEATSLLNAGEEDVFGVYSQLYNIQTLSRTHVYGSKIFSLFESGTMPAVTLTQAQVDMTKGTVAIEGTASNYDAVVNQAAAYRNVAGVAQAQLTSVRGESPTLVRFSMELLMQKGYFSNSSSN